MQKQGRSRRSAGAAKEQSRIEAGQEQEWDRNMSRIEAGQAQRRSRAAAKASREPAGAKVGL